MSEEFSKEGPEEGSSFGPAFWTIRALLVAKVRFDLVAEEGGRGLRTDEMLACTEGHS